LRKKFTSRVFSTIPTNFRVWSLDFPNFNFKDHPNRDADAAVEARIPIGWYKFRQLVPLLINMDILIM